MTELSKSYEPREHEGRIWSRWETARAFAADPTRVLSGDAPPYCILMPPPNVTGALHLGHALNGTIQDVLARAHRLKGYETCWLPGTDHAGIATQSVVDKRLAEADEPALADYKAMQDAGEPGRARFVEKVQAWKDEYEARITGQFRKLGASADWDRLRFTMDAICADAVREAFFLLFRDGLIYRGQRLVNWDPVTQTALADDEVESHEVEGHFYYLRYPLIHRAAPGDHNPVTWGELEARGLPGAEQHPEDDEAWITIATTRPETFLGDVAVAVNPSDPRAAAVRGLSVQLPLVGRVIPIIEDEYVVLPVRYGGPEGDAKAEYATGFLKVTPAHDPNDYDLGVKHKSRIEAECSAGEVFINVMAPDASISDRHGWTDLGDAHLFVGLSREKARTKVVEEFQAHTLSDRHPLLEDIRPYTHSVGHSYRSHAPVEYYLSDQWYCRVTDDRLRGSAQRALRRDQRAGSSLAGWPESAPAEADTPAGDGSMTFCPARYARAYESWHDGLRDWCISRQLWWGHRIPVWTKSVDRESPPDEAFEDRLSRLILDDTIAINTEEIDDRTIRRSVCVRREAPRVVEDLEAHGFTQDPDVLDTWFSSALWPLSTMGWPEADLPAVSPAQIDPASSGDVRQVWVKRVGSFSRFIGTEGEHSGDLIDTLLHLRDTARAAGGGQPIAYQLFSEADLRGKGPSANPKATPDQIQSLDDMVCAVAVKTDEPVRTDKFGEVALESFLLSHGFRPTAGLLEAFNPSSVLCTAREIITLWVSRMVMFNRYFRGGGAEAPVPFMDVFIHAMIQDGDGRKMSKSLGNGVDPLDIIESHGADALRFTLVEMTTQTQDVRMPVTVDERTGRNTSPKFDLGRNFCNKLWNAARFALSNLAGSDAAASDADGGLAQPPAVTPDQLTLPDRWILARLHAGTREIDHALETYQFSGYAKALYDLVRRDFCDWYLEAVKPTVRESPTQQAVLRGVLDALLRLLHPVIPYITEAIYEVLAPVRAAPVEGLTLRPPRKGGVLCTARWPQVDDVLIDQDALERFARVQSLVDAIRQVRSQQNVDPKRRVTLHAGAGLPDFIAGAAGVVEALAGLGRVTTEAPEGPASALVFEKAEHHLSGLAEALDPAAEEARLKKELQSLTGKHSGLAKRLANPGYVDKAPTHLVEETRKELASVEDQIDTVKDALGRLGA